MSVERAHTTAHLEVWAPGGMSVVMLAGASVSIGRAEGRDVVLDHDEEVSSLHAVLQAYGAGWTIRDLGSTNGTTVAGERLVGERALRHGDAVQIGRTRLIYRNAGTATIPGTTATQKPRKPPDLTPRERDVLEALCQPLFSSDVFRVPAETKDIASALVVTEAAVKQHLLNLYEKFELDPTSRHRRVELANEALRRGAI